MARQAWAARQWLLGLHLAPLGEAPAVFAPITRALRRKRAHVPDAAWEAGRLAFLRRIAATPVLYRSPALARAFAAAARANLPGKAGVYRRADRRQDWARPICPTPVPKAPPAAHIPPGGGRSRPPV